MYFRQRLSTIEKDSNHWSKNLLKINVITWLNGIVQRHEHVVVALMFSDLYKAHLLKYVEF